MGSPQSVPRMEDTGPYADILAGALRQLCGPLDAATLDDLVAQVQLTRLGVGETLYRQGDPGATLHIVLTGRLQVRVALAGGGEQTLAHPQPGDVVGEMALLAGSPRAATVTAVRDTTLGTLARATLDDLVTRDPGVFSRMARMIIARLSGEQGRIAQRTGTRTLMLVPLHEGVDGRAFARALRQALLPMGSVLHLDAAVAAARLPADADYGRFLDDCERLHDYVILQADPTPSVWTRRCYGYADRILLLADAAASSARTGLEQWLFAADGRDGAYAEVELVLLHGGGRSPRGTRAWLEARPVARHHHLRTGDRADMARLARCLSDNAVALVLAGGGARGFAHLGVIRALREEGIPMDAVGGASFGALAATGLARGLADAQIFAEQYQAFTREDPLSDYTIPIVSLVRGQRLERILQHYLPMDVEDLWLPFFAVSSDLSANQVRVHDSGPLWRAIRASVSLPGILPPALDDGHLLVDGGILNNLPVDVMRERVRGRIIAVDLAVDREFTLKGDMVPLGLEYLKSRLLPWRQPIEAPTISRVIMKTTTLASRKEVSNARKLADLYLNPALNAYDFLDWNSLREIAEVGYAYARPRVEQWALRQGSLVDRRAAARAWLGAA